jgi:hypothetical protein
MDTNNFSDSIYMIIRPVLIYGGVFLIAFILSKFDVHTYLIMFIAVITGIILEKILKKRSKVWVYLSEKPRNSFISELKSDKCLVDNLGLTSFNEFSQPFIRIFPPTTGLNVSTNSWNVKLKSKNSFSMKPYSNASYVCHFSSRFINICIGPTKNS